MARRGSPPPLDDGGPIEPRRHHYLYAHLRLRQLALSDPARFVAAVGEPGFLEHTWARVAAEVPEELRLDAGGLVGRVSGPRGRRVAVVRMPPPEVPTECYFLGVREDLAAMLTLELARDTVEAAWTTATGRWSTTGHELLGFGEPADETGFAALVAAQPGLGAGARP